MPSMPRARPGAADQRLSAGAGGAGADPADSGNGGHALWRIDLPVADGGLVQDALRALARRYDDALTKIDQTVGNPARISKLRHLGAQGDSPTDARTAWRGCWWCPTAVIADAGAVLQPRRIPAPERHRPARYC